MKSFFFRHRQIISCVALIAISPSATAALIPIEGATGLTGNYNVQRPLGVTISNDEALYLVTRMTFTNPDGAFQAVNTFPQASFFNVNAERFGVGSPPNNGAFWGLMSGMSNLESTSPIVLGEPTLLVMKINQVSGDVNFWVNPDLSQPEPETADISRTNETNAKSDVTNIRLRGGGYGGQTNSNIADYDDVQVYYDGDNPFSTGTLQLRIKPSPGNPGNYDFEWDSRDGKFYDLVTNTDLTETPETWSVWMGNEDIAGISPINTLANVDGGGDPRRFFVVIEKNERSPLFDERFDAPGPGLPAGWVAAKGSGTVWEVGDPTSLPNLLGDDGTNCVGTNVVAGDYGNVEETVTMTSPAVPIPSGGATLKFRQYIDSDAPNDYGTIRLLGADGTEITEGLFPITQINGAEAGWTDQSHMLPPSAAGQSVKLVFEFTTNADGTVYKGFYLDNVLITAN